MPPSGRVILRRSPVRVIKFSAVMPRDVEILGVDICFTSGDLSSDLSEKNGVISFIFLRSLERFIFLFLLSLSGTELGGV